MDKYKIVKSEGGNYVVFTRDYFWQKWHRVTKPDGTPIVAESIEEVLRTVGSAWWTVFWIKVNSIGTF